MNNHKTLQRLSQIIQAACEECCLSPVVINSCLITGPGGIYSLLTATNELFELAIALPESNDEIWDGNVAMTMRKGAALKCLRIPISKLIDTLQSNKPRCQCQ